MLLSAYLFLVVLSFLFWLTAPEKAEALEIEKQKNFLQAEDSERVVREHLNQEDGRFSEFPITIEKINEIISNLNSRNARIVAQKLGIKQRIGKRNRTKAELLEKIFEKLETEKIILIQSLNELRLLTIN
jgi:parvulin-like peptidyl-prolyl isomerase